MDAGAGLSADEELVLRLNSQFPGDVGVFSVYLLNYLRLRPMQALFLRAGLPHAYIRGGTTA